MSSGAPIPEQVVANATMQSTYHLMRDIYRQVHGPRDGDADPIIQGAITAAVLFMATGSAMTDAQILAHIVEVVERMTPQARFAAASLGKIGGQG
jgi:hypothetical protein